MADQAEQEPSMEEILSSIRRIINEDDDDAAAEPAPAAAETVADDFDFDAIDDAAADEDDVLDLTEMVDDPNDGTDPLAMDDDLMVLDREPEPIEDPEIDFSEFESELDDGIMSQPTAAAAMGAFHQLADTIRISEEEGRTLEGVVRAILRPMLKEWLDAHLPRIVDEKVQAEIDRVARRRR